MNQNKSAILQFQDFQKESSRNRRKANLEMFVGGDGVLQYREFLEE